MNIVNLTPHELRLHTESGVEVHRSAGVARVSSTSTGVGSVAGVALVRATVGEVVGLPAPEEGTLFVVSAMVRAALPGRADLASPGDLVRDEAGAVVGCKSLIVN